MDTGIALSVTGDPIGLALIIYFVAKPASLTISSPKTHPIFGSGNRSGL